MREQLPAALGITVRRELRSGNLALRVRNTKKYFTGIYLNTRKYFTGIYPNTRKYFTGIYPNTRKCFTGIYPNTRKYFSNKQYKLFLQQINDFAGSFGPTANLVSAADCTPCTAGKRCPESGLMAAEEDCPAGYFCEVRKHFLVFYLLW